MSFGVASGVKFGATSGVRFGVTSGVSFGVTLVRFEIVSAANPSLLSVAVKRTVWRQS